MTAAGGTHSALHQQSGSPGKLAVGLVFSGMELYSGKAACFHILGSCFCFFKLTSYFEDLICLRSKL